MKSDIDRLPGLWLTLVLMMGLFQVAASPAATIRVTAVVDDLSNNGNCTLREAVRAANSDVPIDECAAGMGEDTILLPAGVYRLTRAGSPENMANSGDLDILEDVRIEGAGSEVTIIDGGGIDRVLHVDPNRDQILVVLQGLTIRGGQAPENQDGGGIANFAAGGGLYLDHVVVEHNRAPDATFGGGIFNAGELTLIASVVRANMGGDGGGIFSEADSILEVARYSRITGNRAASNGGGISSGGSLTIEQALVDDNRAGPIGKGGGLINNGSAGMKNVTFSDNVAGPSGGAIHNQSMGNVGIENVTVASNRAASGGGIFNENPNAARVELEANLFADNAGGNCAGTGSPPTSFGYNIEDADTCGLMAAGDQVNVSAVAIALEPLRDNGGYLPTRGLGSGSVAVDALASGSTLADDQRGVSRPADGDGDGIAERDIGAFERLEPIVVNSLVDGLDAVPGDGVCEVLIDTGICTLRAAILEANAAVGWKLVQLGAGTYELGIAGTGEDLGASGDLDITTEMTVRGQGAQATVVDGQGLDRVLDVQNGASGDVVIEDLTLHNGSAAGGGGCLRTSLLSDVREGLKVNRSLLTSCTASTGGGLELAPGAVVELRDTAVRGNTSTGGSGGIRGHADSHLLLLRSEVSDNECGSSGGGMETSMVDLVDSTVSGNTANNGGGIFTNGLTTLWNATIADNTATGGYGGGLFVVGETVAQSSIIADNSGIPGSDNCTNQGVVSRGGNIENTDTCELDVALGDQPRTSPELAPLADNGGPTRTHGLLPTSPAIDAGGASACLPRDQRGVMRPLDGDGSAGAECDIGAYELVPAGFLFGDGFESGDATAWSSQSS